MIDNGDGTAVVLLTRGKVAIIDSIDIPKIDITSWHFDGKYAVSGSGKYMHRLLLNPDGEMDVDHADTDGLNNRQSNLRPCIAQENAYNRGKSKMNSSGYKGVTHRKARGRYEAAIRHNKKPIYLGSFSTAEEAANVYDAAAREMHGQFANTNSKGN